LEPGRFRVARTLAEGALDQRLLTRSLQAGLLQLCIIMISKFFLPMIRSFQGICCGENFPRHAKFSLHFRHFLTENNPGEFFSDDFSSFLVDMKV
jgi:hypothetical protein